MLIFEKNDKVTMSIPLSKARLCGNLECSTIHAEPNCPNCGTAQFIFLEPIINGELSSKITYRYCSSCNAQYKSAIVTDSKTGTSATKKEYHCPVCWTLMP
jgi:hypothetical protein